ncbi:Uncharacterized protein HZ326_12014 [Fusarium oxysporum f. sp. albedinis]|nr:Uncharacterized protein HZ326_12014 [Fusarium oxysporum f. sp. albedinis]
MPRGVQILEAPHSFKDNKTPTHPHAAERRDKSKLIPTPPYLTNQSVPSPIAGVRTLRLKIKAAQCFYSPFSPPFSPVSIPLPLLSSTICPFRS